MKYKAILSTPITLIPAESESKQEILDQLESWFFDHGIDARKNMVTPSRKKTESSTHWEKGKTAISCNFEVNF